MAPDIGIHVDFVGHARESAAPLSPIAHVDGVPRAVDAVLDHIRLSPVAAAIAANAVRQICPASPGATGVEPLSKRSSFGFAAVLHVRAVLTHPITHKHIRKTQTKTLAQF